MPIRTPSNPEHYGRSLMHSLDQPQSLVEPISVVVDPEEEAVTAAPIRSQHCKELFVVVVAHSIFYIPLYRPYRYASQ